ncbi:hypothetical protein MTR_6g024145 [Medicago truncatula]|uniref:Uncharacterized protein n=1 Tax=Medicago truncatula TaxID=3880 RepID=A0A072UI54_MEDTR|nr:hypothetical protein MTR_6g024145 [Medicago truncatula]
MRSILIGRLPFLGILRCKEPGKLGLSHQREHCQATCRGILFEQSGSMRLEAYTDPNFERSIVDRRSTTGYCTCGNLVTWGYVNNYG